MTSFSSPDSPFSYSTFIERELGPSSIFISPSSIFGGQASSPSSEFNTQASHLSSSQYGPAGLPFHAGPPSHLSSYNHDKSIESILQTFLEAVVKDKLLSHPILEKELASIIQGARFRESISSILRNISTDYQIKNLIIHHPILKEQITSLLETQTFRNTITSTLSSSDFLKQILTDYQVKNLIIHHPIFKEQITSLLETQTFHNTITSTLSSSDFLRQILTEHQVKTLVIQNPSFKEQITSLLETQTFHNTTASILSSSDFIKQILPLIIQNPIFKQHMKSSLKSEKIQKLITSALHLDKLIENEGLMQSVLQSRILKQQINSIIKDPDFRTLLKSRLSGYITTPASLNKIGESNNSLRNTRTDVPQISVEDFRTMESQVQVLNSEVQELKKMLSDLQQNGRRASQDEKLELAETEIPTALRDKLARLRPSQEIYKQYVTKHPDIPIGTWISIRLGQHPEQYATYQEAAEANRNVLDWFCREYRGVNPEPYHIFALTASGHYKNNNQPTDLAYIDVNISRPGVADKSQQVSMMIDPGATICLGAPRILSGSSLNLDPIDLTELSVTGIGGSVKFVFMKAEVQMGGFPKIEIPIANPLKDLGTPVQWILGQSFLKKCQHIWTNGTDVKLELTSSKEVGEALSRKRNRPQDEKDPETEEQIQQPVSRKKNRSPLLQTR